MTQKLLIQSALTIMNTNTLITLNMNVGSLL